MSPLLSIKVAILLQCTLYMPRLVERVAIATKQKREQVGCTAKRSAKVRARSSTPTIELGSVVACACEVVWEQHAVWIRC
jgi:hypothetical protein